MNELLEPPRSVHVRPFQETGRLQNKSLRSKGCICNSKVDEVEPANCSGRREAMIALNAAAISLLGAVRPLQAEEVLQEPDTTITHKVYMDVGLCQQANQNRTLGENAFCSQPQQLGRIVVGLYGNLVPATVSNFLELVKSGTYNNTLFNKVLPGEYISAGKQGSARMGEVSLSAQLSPNKDLLSSKSYSLSHQRAGTVSLNLSHSNDDSSLQQSRNYRNVSFLITTAVPTFKPVNDRLLALNRLGAMLGDERADKTKKKWGRPLKPILITDTGVLS